MIATNLSFACAESGLRVLHVGCDPKSDSTWRLTRGRSIPTVIEQVLLHPNAVNREHIIAQGVRGIHCIETGGPEPGVGCGGRGVTIMIQTLEQLGLIDPALYGLVLFDVLGDIVCGGFAAPLRSGFARKVLIAVSEEPMSLFAANNIARAVLAYAHNGPVLAGLILNLRDNTTDVRPLHRFAERLNTKILATVPRDPLILEAERKYMTIVEHAPESPSADLFRNLAQSLLSLETDGIPNPTPLDMEHFRNFIRDELTPS